MNIVFHLADIQTKKHIETNKQQQQHMYYAENAMQTVYLPVKAPRFNLWCDDNYQIFIENFISNY